ncbi:MAG TPA: response regulator [Cyclobacteriaceae bacterium]|nr:response regulator [Cyclobacteriaceae bacterium]
MSNSLRIVLIDDDEDDLEILKLTIRSVHPEVNCVCFFDADVALGAMMKEETPAPHLVFIDINMPRMSGDVCLKEIREQPKFDRTKIVMISTSIPDSFRKKLLKHGASLIFTKPVDIEGYKKIISECFDTDVHGCAVP